MQEQQNKLSTDLENEINLKELVHVLFKGKWIIISLTSLFSIIGVIYSLSLPNIYESKTLLVPVNPTDNISGAIGPYGNMAGFAGFNFLSARIEGNSAKAIRKISSLSFFENNILPNIQLQNLMAVESWNPSSNTMAYDKNIYDVNSNKWVREYSYPRKQIPSAQEGYLVFNSRHLNLDEDKKTGFLTLSIKHRSPFIAKKWAELVVSEVNNFYREKDRVESEKASRYLNNQISMTSLSEIKQVLAQLLQEETKKLTLIEANEFYVFDYVDPPAIMERKSEPSRALICILTAFLGGMLSVLLVLIRRYLLDIK